MTSLLCPDAFLSPLEIDAIVTRALAEDLGRAGDVTSTATIPEDTQATRRRGGAQGRRDFRPAVCRRELSEARARHHHHGPSPRRRQRRRQDRPDDGHGTRARRTLGRTGRPQHSRATVRDRDCDPRIRAAGHRYQAAHLLHPQDHAGAASDREIRRALRRRLQPSLRPRRRDPDQGQPHRRRGRHPRGAGTRPVGRRPPSEDRDRGRHARSAARGDRGRDRRRRAARQHGQRRP